MPGAAGDGAAVLGLLRALASARDPISVARAGVRHVARALEAEAVSVVTADSVVASLGPAVEVPPLPAGRARIDLVHAGYVTVVVRMEEDADTVLALRRRGALTRDEAHLLEGMAQVLSITLRMRALEQQQAEPRASRRRAAERVPRAQTQDPLTGLMDVETFAAAVAAAVARGGEAVAVMVIEIDRLRVVTDSFGPGAGDRLMVQAAERLERCLRAEDLAARVGDDELAILLKDVRTSAEVGRIAGRISKAMRRPFSVGTLDVTVGASIGVALGAGADDAAELLRDARIATGRARAVDTVEHVVFEPAMRAAIRERVERESDLRRAVAERAFVLHYQPIVSLGSRAITGFEALLRWPQRGGAFVAPAEFVPLAEEADEIVRLGRWVLDEACAQAAEWQRSMGLSMSMSVNLSPRQLAHPGIVGDVARAVARAGLEPSSLTLEITENVVLQDLEDVVGRLSALRELGVRVAIDDFGTGFSSLGYLRDLPVDVLKIDKSFVRGIARGAEDSGLARAIVRIAQTFHLETVAEGVEIEGQAAALRALGCERAQGFLYSPAIPAAAVPAFLGSWVRDDVRRVTTRLDERPRRAAAGPV